MIKETQDKTKYPHFRDHLANERTFLAWIRTSIGIIAFGFVFERFVLMTRQIEAFLENPNSPLHGYVTAAHQSSYASVFGILLIALGTFISLMAFLKHKQNEAQIAREMYKSSILLNLFLTGIIFFIGASLVFYLINSVK
jgi:putative membrane protein